jgi:hypothetical protein
MSIASSGDSMIAKKPLIEKAKNKTILNTSSVTFHRIVGRPTTFVQRQFALPANGDRLVRIEQPRERFAF